MATYKELVTEIGHKVIERTEKNGIVSYIPEDEANSDYQRYLRWLENPDADEAQSL